MTSTFCCPLLRQLLERGLDRGLLGGTCQGDQVARLGIDEKLHVGLSA